MNISSCSCTCGNLRIRGLLNQQSHYPHSQASGRDQLSKTLFSIQPHSIEIQRIRKEKGNLHNKPCSDMKCTICGATFRFFSCKGNSYMERIQPTHKHCNKIPTNTNFNSKSNGDEVQLAQQTNQSNNNHLQNSLSVDNRNTDYFNKNLLDKMIIGDSDFELMFSNKYDPVVGSYEQQINATLDGSNISNVRPNSYFA